MITTYSIIIFTKSTLESFAMYHIDVNDNDKLVVTGILTPDELAMAKIIKYIYEKHGGYPKNFTLYNESAGGNMGCPGMFGGVGGPKEVPSPEYMTIEEATGTRESLLNTGFWDENEVEPAKQTMDEYNRLEDQLIESIKHRKDRRKQLLNKIMNVWNISSDGVVHRYGIDQYDENSLC